MLALTLKIEDFHAVIIVWTHSRVKIAPTWTGSDQEFLKNSGAQHLGDSLGAERHQTTGNHAKDQNQRAID